MPRGTQTPNVKHICCFEVICPQSDIEVSFDYTNTSLTFEFTDTSIGNPIMWLWDFGDGSFSNEQNPTHTYADFGDYNVTLTVANEEFVGVSEILVISIIAPPMPITYPEAINDIAEPLLWYKFQGTDPNIAVNSGSAGGYWNAVIEPTGMASGYTGLIGTEDAIQSLTDGQNVYTTPTTPLSLSNITLARLTYIPADKTNGIVNTNFSESTSGYSAGFSQIFGQYGAYVGASDFFTTNALLSDGWVWEFLRWSASDGIVDYVRGYNGALHVMSPDYGSNGQTTPMGLDYFYISTYVIGGGIVWDEFILWDTLATDEQLLTITNLSGLT